MKEKVIITPNTVKTPLLNMLTSCLFVLVFHRILDFNSGLDFYPGPFFILWGTFAV